MKRNRYLRRATLLGLLAAGCGLILSAGAAAEPPNGEFAIAPAEPVYRVVESFDPTGLIAGLECGALSGFAKGKLRAGCLLDRREDDFRAKAGGRFKLDLSRRGDGSRIKVRLVLAGSIKEPGERRQDLRIIIKGTALVPAGVSTVEVPLVTKGCSGSFCERGKATLLVPLESSDGAWQILLRLDSAANSKVSGSARLQFADGASLVFHVGGAFDPARGRSSLVLVPVADLPGTALAVSKLRQARDGGWVAKLRYALYGQSDVVKVAVQRME